MNPCSNKEPLIDQANLTIMSSDMNRSVSFYESLGFVIQQRWGDHFAQMTAPGITIGIHPTRERSAGSGNVSIGLIAKDFDAARSALEAMSVSFTQRTEQAGDFLHFNDPDGTQLYFIRLTHRH